MAEGTTVEKQSRVGKQPIALPKGVTVQVREGRVDVQGPKGKLSKPLPARVAVAQEGGVLVVKSDAAARDGRRLQGLGRALVAAMVKGTVEGYERVLELHGTGYRCEAKGRTLHFQLGFSHPTTYDLPAEVQATIPPDSKGTVLILTSPDKAVLGQVSANIRRIRPAEPYGGKGVRYRGETIRRKAGKAGKGRK